MESGIEFELAHYSDQVIWGWTKSRLPVQSFKLKMSFIFFWALCYQQLNMYHNKTTACSALLFKSGFQDVKDTDYMKMLSLIIIQKQ